MSGLSLVEIMVALLLGLFLLTGIIQVLSSGSTTYRLTETRARLQESGRYAVQYLARELRPGRSGLCRSAAQEESEPESVNVLACALLADPVNCSGTARIGTAVPLGYSVAQYGTSAWLAGLPGDSSAGARAAVDNHRLRGDVLVSWGSVGAGFYASTNMLRNNSAVDLTAPVKLIAGSTTSQLAEAGFKGGYLVMIGDCGHGDIFTVSNSSSAGSDSLEHAMTRGGSVDGARVNRAAALSVAYNDGTVYPDQPRALVAPYDLRVHFICCVDRQTGLVQSGAAGVRSCVAGSQRYHPALCRWSANSNVVQPVVMDVADLRATYDGRKAPNSRSDLSRMSDANDLQTAARIETQKLWRNVYSTRVELLVSGGDDVRTSAQVPVANLTSSDQLGFGMGADKQFYATYSVTIANRARTLWYREQ